MRSSLRLTPRNCGERREAVLDRNTRVPRRDERRQRVQSRMAAELRRVARPAKVSLRRARVRHLAVGADPPLGQRGAFDTELGTGEALDRRPAAAREHAREARFLRIDDHAPARRYRAHQVMELRLDRGQVGEDVGVIVFEIVQDQRARPVMHELGALVEERRVVLVGLDHEEAAVGMARRHAEIQRHAADEEARREPGVIEDPREHRRRAGLAVRAGDREHEAVREHMIAQPFGAGRVREAAVEDRLDQRIAARDDVADDEQIGVGRDTFELRRIVAFGQRDPERTQAAWTSADRRSHRSP